MLLKSKISNVEINTPEWVQIRTGLFTSSDAHLLCSPEGFGVGGVSYIHRKVQEHLSGEPSFEDIDTDDTRWGHMYERESVAKFQVKMGWKFIVVQKFITEAGSRFGSTPDALRLVRATVDGLGYEVENIEAKCPPKRYVELFLCNTPADLKKVSKKYYWQVIDQADACGSIKSHFIAYHPNFKAGNMRHIEFDFMSNYIDPKTGQKIYPLRNELKLLRERKMMAEQKFNEIRDKFLLEEAI